TLYMLQGKIGEFEGKPITVAADVKDESARKKLEELGFKIDNFDESTGVADITVNDQAALDKLNKFILEEMPKVDGQTAEAHAILEADGLFATNDFALTQLALLDGQTPNPLA